MYQMKLHIIQSRELTLEQVNIFATLKAKYVKLTFRDLNNTIILKICNVFSMSCQAVKDMKRE